MSPHPLAGKEAPPEILIDPTQLEVDYYNVRPDPADARQAVSFGTSGHRGTPSDGSFNEAHILAITQALCEYRRSRGITGPLYLARDTHAISPAAQRTALEVLAANEVEMILPQGDAATPTPVLSRAILVWNREHSQALADGVAITPSHNPPGDGGFKYNPPEGGPADSDVTAWIQDRANELLRAGNRDVKRVLYLKALRSPSLRREDLMTPYVEDLTQVLDLELVRSARPRLGVDPMGGASLEIWWAIAERFRLDITIVNATIDPAFRFMRVDYDGKIRMDCSSPFAMASLVELKEKFDLSFGNDPDADRHGIVTRSSGLMNPNHYLSAAVAYLLAQRPGWPHDAKVGKTLVSSSLIDRVVASAGRALYEVPVGFKWFVPGLFEGDCCFAGEESAGASFLRKNGKTWTTDKDGILLALLAAEMLSRTDRDPGELFENLAGKLGMPHYTRIDTPASPEQKRVLQDVSEDSVHATHLAGEPILRKLTSAPGNGKPIGGLKVVAANGWFAARPSGTEEVVKLYAESFKDPDHLMMIVDQAREWLAGSA